MSKKRVYEFAKELDIDSKKVIKAAQDSGIQVKNHMGMLSNEDQQTLKQTLTGKKVVTQKTTSKPINKKQNHHQPHPQKTTTNSKQQIHKTEVKQEHKTGQKPVSKSIKQEHGSNKHRASAETNARSAQTHGNKKHGQEHEKKQNYRGKNTDSQPVKQGTTSEKMEKNTQQKPSNKKTATSSNTHKRKNQSYGNQGYQKNRFNKKRKGKHQESKKPAVPPRKYRELPEVLVYSDGMTIADLAKKLHREPAEIIKKLFMMGIMATLNQALDKETIELLAMDYGIKAEEKIEVDVADIDKYFEEDTIDPDKLMPRPPVVTIMGHVDHGKTTLLDTLRHTKVSLGEAGGITQHIGAYQLDVNDKPITFLDTPGHAAFTSMRARGAQITDITILVVAADDGVMPQTIEAINHSKAADVPIIVAVNKVDKPTANPDHVMQQLTEYGLIPESWGGDTIFVPISAKFGQNIDELLEMILLVAEVQELKADPTHRPIGTVIEARLDKGKGPVSTLLVQEGTLRVGDPIVVGNTFGRVRVMSNDIGRRIREAGPATPVEITGLNDVPQARDRFAVYDDEKTARQAGEERANRALQEQRASAHRVTLDNLFESLQEGELKQVDVIIKADAQGSVEALAASLQKIEVSGVKVNIIHTAVGAINESDVTLASASNAIIIGFNVRPTPQAKSQAEQESVDIRLHRVIYRAIEEIETAMKGMLEPEYQEKITGQMIVRETFKVSKVGTIAGCYVTDGSIHRDSGVRLIREGIVIYEGKLASLKRFKDDVKEVKQGYECGAMIENFNDLKEEDVIEGYIMEEIKVN